MLLNILSYPHVKFDYKMCREPGNKVYMEQKAKLITTAHIDF